MATYLRWFVLGWLAWAYLAVGRRGCCPAASALNL